MSDRNYYEILGVPASADGNTVNQTYWHLARKYQALAPSDARATEFLDELNEAYGVLGSPDMREAYDKMLFAADGTNSDAPAWRLAMPSISLGGIKMPSGFGRALKWRPSAPSVQFGTGASERPAVVAKARERVATQVPATLRRATSTVEQLRASTASRVGRLRETVIERERQEAAPDTTLVDIFKSEEQSSDEGEPLMAALNVLRGRREPVKS